MKRRKYLIILVLLLFSKNAAAYIDPGTAGTIISGGIWPFILALLALVGGIFFKGYRHIKAGVTRIWRIFQRKKR